MLRKTSLLFSVLFFSLIAMPTHAAWVQKDLGTIQGLQAITQAGGNFFTVGNTGNILRSTDGGITWSVYDNNASVYWQDIETSGSTVRVIGENGAMRESTDNGVTWNPVNLGVAENLYEMRVSADHGYIVGSGGRILNYNANGKIWQIVTSPTTLALYGIHDFGNGTAWVVGEQGILLSTTDSGITWTNKGKIANDDLHGIWFSSATTGYAVGRNGTFVKTTDSGYSWTPVSVSGLSSEMLYDIKGSGSTIVIAGDKIVIRSTDGGQTWTTTDYTSQNFALRGITFSSMSDAWVVGTKDDSQSVILKFESEVVPVTPPVVTPPPTSPSVILSAPEGSLVKTVCISNANVNDPCRSVYFYGSDGKRHAFPNDKIFFTWYANFDSVKEVSTSFLSSLPLGKNVTYHPGTKMVKFQTVPTVYAVSLKGQLHAIGSESLAASLYGATWNKQIDDISDAFFGNYTFGTKIESVTDYDVIAAKTSVVDLNGSF